MHDVATAGSADRAPADILEDILKYLAFLQHHSDKNNRFGYRIFRNFAANEWIRRPDIRICRDFAATEWIRRPDIRIFRDFATGTGTWYWYSICAPDPYIRILVYTDFILGYLSDIWRKNIGYLQP
jgi:hypothetical protein